jgi:uncharacterized protein (DUF885 family)
MAAEAAVAMLVDIAGLNPDSAKAEVNRYTYTPGYQLSYLYGKHLLLDLRAQVEAKQGDGFRLRDFHDRLLGAGALPAEFWPQLFDL